MVLINGAPGSGKSTLADALAKALPAAGAIDLDGIKHSLPSWPDDQQGSGLEARHRALAEARTFIDTDYDVVLGQYLARTEFIEQLDQLALETRADFIELCLDIDEHTLADRLASRAAIPSRPEHSVNNHLASSKDARQLVESLAPIRESRPKTIWIDARGTAQATLAEIQASLS
ncbi:AAA family ATPase [soil metagenome]